MPYLESTVEFVVYTDTNQTEFPQELVPQIKKEFSSTTVTQAQVTTFTLAALGSQSITLNGLSSVKRFYLYSSATGLTVNINGLGNVTYAAQEPGYCPITVTSMSITNASAITATTVTLVLIAST